MKNRWTGWSGKFLRINLTTGKIKIEEDDPEIMYTYIGGLGVGIKYLMDEVDPRVGAFSPKNKLIIATGPLTGVAFGGNKIFIETKSPLTGGIANPAMGGYFGAELKFAGYDFIIVEGKANKPVYIWIENDNVEIRPAIHIWGQDTQTTEDIILSESDQLAQIIEIGPAGEKLVRFANVIGGGAVAARAAGRGGAGAVMGSKNLKAIAVRGTKGIKVADSDAFKEMNYDNAVMKAVVDKSSVLMMLREGGTLGTALEWTNSLGILPTKNFQTGVNPDAKKIGGSAYTKQFSARGSFGKACFGCPCGCSRLSIVKDTGYEMKAEGPEYESVNSLGGVNCISNLAAILKANDICNSMGIDAISMGVTIGCANELYEKGYLPEGDVGYKLGFGKEENLLDLVKKTAFRDGFGNILAEGSYRLAKKYGHPELSMSAKKMEFPNYDLRGIQGTGLAFITNNRGGDHCRAEVNIEEQFESTMLGYWSPAKPIDPYSTKGKAEMAKTYQDYCNAAFHSFGQCYFLLCYIKPEEVIALFESVTGFKTSGLEEIKEIGERIFNLERIFNYLAGMSGADDAAPPRFLKEPLPDGPAKGLVSELAKMLPEYYRLRGWDENGVPTAEKLKELGIEKSGELLQKYKPVKKVRG